MPTITAQDRTTPTMATISNTTQERVSVHAKYEAALAKIAGTTQNTVEAVNGIPSKIDSKGVPLSPEEGGPSTPQGSVDEEPISHLNAKDDVTTEDKAKQADHVAQLARREKAAWAQIKQLKAEKADLEKAVKPAPGLTKEQVVSLLRTNPGELGLTYEDLGQMYLNKDAPVDPLVQRMQARIDELESRVTDTVNKAAESQKTAYDQALAQIDREAKALVSKSQEYEVIKSQGAESAITELIELTYKEEGILLGVEEAAAQVEAHLEAEAIALFTKSTKLKAKLQPVDTNVATKQPSNPQRQTNNTLTPAMSQASAKPMSARERAIAAFHKNTR